MNAIVTVATKELRDGLRNRWVMANTVVFALFALGIAYFGAAAAGTVGFTGLATTIVSLSSLAVFLIPLIALLIAYDSIIGEEEQGTLQLLLSYPLTRLQLLTGKLLGHGAMLAISTLLGFGLAGLVIAVLAREITAPDLLRALSLFMASAMLLGWSFIAIGYLISVRVTEKSRAAGLALVVWFVFVLVYDLALLGTLIATGGSVGRDLLPWLLLANPTDVFRLVNLTSFEAVQAHAGLLSMGARAQFHPALLLGTQMLWVGAPFSVAAWLFARREV